MRAVLSRAAHNEGMAVSRYRVPLRELDQTHVPADEQVESQPTSEHAEVLDPADLDRRRLLNDPAGAGRLWPGR